MRLFDNATFAISGNSNIGGNLSVLGTGAFNLSGTARTSFGASTSFHTSSGTTMQIGAGAVLTFGSYASMLIEGKLLAMGTTSNHILLTSGSTWSGLCLSGTGTSNSVLDYVDVRNVLTYGGSAVNVYNTAGLIFTHNSISNCGNYSTTGLYLSGASSPDIGHNSINNCGYYGIAFYNTNGYVYHNGIDWNTAGGVNLSYSSPSFGKPGFLAYNGNNTIQGGSYGIYAANNSYPYVGAYGNSYYGYNNIVGGSSARVYATGGSNVFAENNWWNSPYPNPSWFQATNNSTIDWNPYLYGQIGTLLKAVQGNDLNRDTLLTRAQTQSLSDSSTTLRKAWDLLRVGDAKSAARLFFALLKAARTEAEATEALSGVQQAYAVTLDPTLLSWVASSDKVALLTDGIRKLALGRMFLAKGDRTEANNTFSALSSAYGAASSVGKAALLDFFSANLTDKAGQIGAQTALATLSTALEANDPEVQQARWVWALTHDPQGLQLLKPVTPMDNSGIVPTETALLGSYPNPFNPATTIRFSLQKDANVSLVVYDLLGREVATIAEGPLTAGYHTSVWNAQNFASGVYLVRLYMTQGTGMRISRGTAKLVLTK
jgi:hypothetical protein